MRYRELLRLYDKKALSEQEMKQVEREIERQDAISEYLFERDGVLPFGENDDRSDGDTAGAAAAEKKDGTSGAGTETFAVPESERQRNDAQKFTREVNRLIRRAFVKMGISVGCVVLAVMLFVMFALPKVVSLFYYDPTEQAAENTQVFGLDLRVYTELTMPGYIRENVSVQDNGYGNYDFTIYQNISYNRNFTNIAGTIEKGSLHLYDLNLLKRPSGNVFAWFQMRGDSSDSLRELTANGATVYSCAGGREMATETLQGLSDTEMYVAYITLDKMMPYEEFMQFVEESEYPVSWCAVSTKSSETVDGAAYFRAENLGFQCNPDHSNMLNWDRETYPHLILWDEEEYGTDEGYNLDEYVKKESYMQEHFASMLRYLAEQKEFLAMMEGQSSSELMAESFLSAADYVEQNGLVVYGCVAIADKETILQMNEDAAVYEIYTEELR